MNILWGWLVYRYRALVVLYPNSRITNLLFYQSGFRREYSIRRRVEQPIEMEGGLPKGLAALCFTGGLWEGLTALFSKLMLYDCVWMRRTNKYEASAEFWSAVLLSSEGSSWRQTKHKKGVNADLLNNYQISTNLFLHKTKYQKPTRPCCSLSVPEGGL